MNGGAVQTVTTQGTRYIRIQQNKTGALDNLRKIATINAVSTGNNSYDYTDATVYKGTMYYRLKMIDIDGKYTFSRILSLSRESKAAINLYPNPVVDRLMISVDNSLMNTEASLYDVSGRLMQTIRITSGAQRMNVTTLRTGIYMIRFKDGSSGSFVKK